MWQSSFAVSVEDDIFNSGSHARFKSISQSLDMRGALVHLFKGETRGCAKGDDASDRFRSGATFALLMPADILRDEPHAATNEERARALRRVEFVSGEREQVAAKIFNINGHPSSRLNRICVKAQVTISLLTRFTNERAYLCDWLNRSDLVVGKHQGDENRVRPQRRAHVLYSDNAVFVNGQTRHFPALLLKRVADAAHARMLYL